jgi:YVTN family beta-propeller protein
MMRMIIGVVTTGLLLLALVPSALQAEENQPVYVGARACATCHDGAGMGYQYSKWLMTRHSHAYAALRMPGARKIAELSGIPQDPYDSPVCLGCHATAVDAEPWQRDAAFKISEGVQCEKCHGPGSDYMDMKVMADPQAAMAAGLQMPTKQMCMKCHYVKGSHAAVLKRPQLNIDEAWKRIAHPMPKNPTVGGLASPQAATPLPGPKYVGVAACAKCHDTAMMNRQASAWRLTDHAEAWARLATLAAAEMARKMGVEDDPQKSPMCLKCHATGSQAEPGQRMEGHSVAEGVTCEACHGPGSEYLSEAVMRDPVAAKTAGLKRATKQTCMTCHEKAHGRAFDVEAAMKKIAHPRKPDMAAMAQDSINGTERYKTPRNPAVRPDGAEVWVACEASNSVIVVDARARRKVAEIPVGGQPNDVAFSPDGSRAYVSNRLDDDVSVIDTTSRKALGTITVGDEPHGLVVTGDGQRLVVVNTASNDISIVDTASMKEVARLSANRTPWSVALAPDGRTALVTNALSEFVGFREPSVSEITMLDGEAGRIKHRYNVPGTNLLQGVAWHPSGEFAFFTLNRTKNLVPMTRILQGWTITNGLGIAWRDGTIDQVLLDEPNLFFADTADVAFTADGKYALATSLSTNRIAIIDVDKLLGVIRHSSARQRAETLPNHLGLSTEFVVKYIDTPDAPNGIATAPDGKSMWVANSLDDSLSFIDMKTLEPTRVDLGGPKVITETRWGEKLFHSANITFQRQFSCHSCHPDGHVDGLTYDIEPDGIGVSPVDNRSLRGIFDTDPFKWEGTNPSLARQCGARLAVFFTRIQPFTPEQLAAVNLYTETIPRPPNRYRPLGAALTPAQSRGKAIFERTHRNDGALIPVNHRCVTCHFPPLYTDRSKRDVGTVYKYDRKVLFDVPQLVNVYDSSPYLHNGMAHTLEEIWTRFNPYDTHGVTNDMTKDQLNDLIEYLMTL